ncbi:MAG: hypothetical protein JO250_10600 [Armatimonadetes bacterium]|nr:hypothetical protein [Armatimonadota bacterium]
MRKTLSALALGGLALLPAPLRAQQNVPQAPGVRDLQSDTWVATDALGRTLPTAAETRRPRKDKFVGIFYFLWHGYHGTDGPYDISKIIADPAHNTWGPLGAFHWWGEPAVGYFRSDDPWVQRKNLQMLTDAGVDVLCVDATNAFTYPKEVDTLCRVAEEMRRQGNPTPQIAFVTHAGPGQTVTRLYNDFYSQSLYKDLWFYWDGKPLILGDRNGKMDDGTPMDPKIVDFFTWRYSWAWDPGQDKWQWIDKYPQRAGWHDAPDRPEEVPVSIAGHPVDSLGRSYHSDEQWGHGTEPPLDAHYLATDINKGIQFDQQWQQALKIDPQFIFVTGWNEWVAQRFTADGPRPFAGHTINNGDTFFVDQYNEEFSRDAMPMRGGYGDDYYLQLVDGIRRFKGVRPLPIARGFQTIALGGGFGQWRNVQPEYRDTVGNVTRRDWPGWGSLHYTNDTGRNDITAAKVACDDKNIYFYVTTHDRLTPYTDPNWMQLLIDADQDPKTGWHGYDFLVNGQVLNGGKTTLRRLRDGKTWPVPYRAAADQLMVTIPRALLGLTRLQRTAFDFHWIDNVQVGPGGADVTTWWYDGDSAPDGRFNYRYINIHKPRPAP